MGGPPRADSAPSIASAAELRMQPHTVAPAQAGAQWLYYPHLKTLDSRLRGNDSFVK
ncbi:hypothetical protein GP5015_1167 [gamma proteobacterium HTCC5015]|nr:hypothetical protein GP5015_1167 [gamma proteobacterium HTCC5015]